MKCLILGFCFLTGCSSLQNAGYASYSVTPFETSTGAVVCCAVTVQNGKEIASLKAHIVKQGDNYTVDLEEVGVQAFQGQSIAAGASKSVAKDALSAAATAGVVTGVAPALGAGIQLLK